ncbi:MAG: cobalt transporter CbiM [Deltaproteobacteria bacterium]|nr:cobalt transporter CbiM [Deltaproteobacteria bacterium]NIS78251.1 cobalt transporter CbiM [Deltaproteobacteria bacterium]
MHVSEGVLSPPVLAAGAIVTAAGVTVGIRRMKQEGIPKAAVLTSSFFVGSLIQIPAGVASVHLVLNGIMGLFLGWACYPCFLVALALQAVLFQFGGLTTLGVNTFVMAAPAIAFSYLFRGLVAGRGKAAPSIGGFLAGFSSVLGGALLIALLLDLSGEGFLRAGQVVVLAHLPVMVIEGIITGMIVLFIRKVKPEMFEVAHDFEKENI